MMDEPLLSVRDLGVTFQDARVVDGLSFDLCAGEVLGMVGESGSGKSLSALAIMGLAPRSASVTVAQLRFAGQDVRGARAAGMSMIFQDPRGALNPVRPVGQQIADVIIRHDPARPAIIRTRVLEALDEVRLSDPRAISKAYPHELSGGQCQRIGIAAALASRPRMLIADEPTTGLDTITQAGIMELIADLVRDRDMGMILITHDLALAAGRCDRIMVLHVGQLAEMAPVADIFAQPRHPYTAGLIRSTPSLAQSLEELESLRGHPPDAANPYLPPCRFAGRCPRRVEACDRPGPDMQDQGTAHVLRCQNPL